MAKITESISCRQLKVNKSAMSRIETSYSTSHDYLLNDVRHIKRRIFNVFSVIPTLLYVLSISIRVSSAFPQSPGIYQIKDGAINPRDQFVNNDERETKNPVSSAQDKRIFNDLVTRNDSYWNKQTNEDLKSSNQGKQSQNYVLHPRQVDPLVNKNVNTFVGDELYHRYNKYTFEASKRYGSGFESRSGGFESASQSHDNRRSSVSFADPCTAKGFVGDIALTDEDIAALGLRSDQINRDKPIQKDYRQELTDRSPLEKRSDVDGETNVENKGRHNLVDSKTGFRDETRASRARRAATSRRERLWEDGVIPYEIDANFSGQHKALFKQAMRHWENNTCLTFVEKSPQDYDYIIFTERPCGCCSFVGKRGNGAQAISIGKNCDKFGIVVHELGHVVGFWHEHTRPDRNDFVKIMYENIMQGQDSNFVTVAPNEVNSLGEGYDFQSIMHYARNTFSRSSYLDSIVPLRSPVSGDEQLRPEIGQRIRLSKGDIAQANKLYNCPRCGRTLQDSSGTFGTDDLRSSWEDKGPYYPSHSRAPMLCQWRISATHGEKIVFNFVMINIPDSSLVGNSRTSDCRENYVEIRDGHYRKSPIIGRFCGSTPLPSPIISSDSRLWIEYRSVIPPSKHQGFSAKYDAVCGGEILKESGTLSSPNYPDYYKPSKDCVWRIVVPEGFTIALMFQSFEIENHDNCVYDYLEIRDGESENSPLLHKLCGYKIPPDVHSSTNKLYVRFLSDGSVQKEGFSASFVKEFDECKTSGHGCEHMCVNTLGGYKCECRIGYELNPDGKRCDDTCGGYLDASNGTIQSPLFPDLYPPNKNCIWLIEAPAQHRITVTFEHFDIEGNNQDCEYDSVELRSGPDAQAKTYGTFCGNQIPQPITSDSNTLRLTFTSDNTVQKNGFVAHFFTDKDECSVSNGGCQHICKNTVGSYQCSCHNGFTLHANKHDCKEGGCQYAIHKPQGEVSSPNWPDNYPNRKDCMWYFSATAGHRIKLVFTEFELEAHLECTYDWIHLFDGPDERYPKLGVFCGSKIPQPIVTSGSHMFMILKTDASVQRRGFHALHSTVCGGNLMASDKANQIYSHAKYGDQNYENREDCEWLITTDDDRYSIRFRFLSFEIEEEIECGYDYAELFDGIGNNWTSIGRFCGNKIPQEIISSSNRLKLQFKTDDTIFWKGFSAEYSRIPRRESSNNNHNHNRIINRNIPIVNNGRVIQGGLLGPGGLQPLPVAPPRGRRWEDQAGTRRYDTRHPQYNTRVAEHRRRHARHQGQGQYRVMT